MTVPTKELHPAVQLLKDNAVVIGIVAILAVSITYFAFSQAAASTPQPTAQPTAPQVSAAPLESVAGPGARPSSAPATKGERPATSAPPAAEPTPTFSPGTRPVVGAVPGAGTTAVPEIVAGGAQQAVTAADWRPAAKGFAASWANPAGGKKAWLARMKPHATPGLIASFAYTDIRNIPSDDLVHVGILEERAGTVTFTASFEQGGERFEGLAIIQPNGTWLVDKVAPPAKK